MEEKITYLELVEGSFTQEHFGKQKNQNPYVAYSINDDKVIYSIVPKEDEDEFTGYGYVDLGLSVMWSEYNIGADSPEQMGNLFEWRGSVSGDEDYELSLDKDPVYQASISDIRKFTPKTPTVAQVKELLKCNKVEETLNGVPGTRFTADNGNSIFIPENDYWTPVTSTASTYITTKATSWSPSKGIQDNTTLKTVKLPFRGVCSNLPKDNAILLEYDKQILVVDDRLYCFPKTWSSTVFKTSTGNTVKMYASPSYDFKYDSEDCYIYPFSKEVDGRVLNLSSTEISVVTDMAVDDYVYVRFACDASIPITPEIWDPSECVDQSTLIRPNEAFGVMARSSKTIFRMRYADFAGYDLTIQWSGAVPLPTYISDVCSYTLSSSNSHVLKYVSIARKSSVKIDAATVDSWASRVSEDGYLYVRFNPINQGTVTFVTDNPVV